MPTIQEFKTSIEALRHEIPSRFRAPWLSMTFYLYLAIGVIGGGGMGIWNTLHQTRYLGWHWETIAAALYTYFPAIVATALLDLQQEERKYWKSFGLFALFPFAIVFYFSTVGDSMGWRFVWAFFGSMLALAFWVVANGDKDCFRDLDIEAATPPPTVPLAGNSKGWNI